MEIPLIIVISAAALFFAVKYFILKKRIRSISKQLDSSENRSVSIELDDKDIEELTLKINRLSDNTERAALIGRKNEEALRLSVADVSHDMRTPLTSVIGYLQLAKKACTDEKAVSDINIALERAEYCSRLVNDFFELSVVDSGGMKYSSEKLDAAGLLCEQILAGYPCFEKNNITPHFEKSDLPVFVCADSGMLARIIQNLISNAVKYSTGDVFFSLSQENGRVILCVSNPTDAAQIDTEHIFDRFYRNDRSRHSDGSGLGLYICRRFAQSMGGEISADFDCGQLSVKLFLPEA